MCGIAGLVALDNAPVAARELQAMADALAHRGPDGHGILADGALGLAHRRLAVIDLPGGAQPMTSPCGRFAIAFNGEIYNYRELRRELQGLGRVFATASDTEVALAACERWGADAFARLRGMFAIAVADRRDRTMLLARDHLGIKPLLWLRVGQRLAFASELQALRRLPWFDATLDHAALDQYLRFQYIPAPATAWRAVRKLPPGHHLRLEPGREPVLTRYWSPDWTRTDDLPAEEWIERIDAAVGASVRAHLVADVPFGALLSGGVDSSLVAAHMRRALGAPPTLFTIGFAEAAYDETAHAQVMARRLGAVHRVEVVRPDALALLPDLVRHYGEPFGDASAIPTWHVSRLARREVTMVLSGDGGDEMFAGYHSYADWRRWLAGEGRPGWKRLLRRGASLLAPRRWPPLRADAAAWFNLVAWSGSRARDALWRPELRPAELLPEHQLPAGLDPLTLAQSLDVQTYLPSCILTKVDIASMYHALEVRTPLVDVTVLELAMRIPARLRQTRGAGGRWQGKHLLRRAAERHYGSGAFDRPKQGFALPMDRWLAPQGSTDPDVARRLADPASPLHRLFTASGIASWVADAHPGRLWLLLVLDEWLRQQEGTA